MRSRYRACQSRQSGTPPPSEPPLRPTNRPSTDRLSPEILWPKNIAHNAEVAIIGADFCAIELLVNGPSWSVDIFAFNVQWQTVLSILPDGILLVSPHACEVEPSDWGAVYVSEQLAIECTTVKLTCCRTQ